MQVLDDELHLLFDCPCYSIIIGQHLSLLGQNYQQWEVGRFTSSILLHIAFICAFKIVLLMSHSWLHIPEWMLLNETNLQCDVPSVLDVMHMECRELHSC